MDTKILLQKLHQTALASKVQIATANSSKKDEENSEQKELRKKAEKIVQEELTEEKMMDTAKKGRMHHIVFMLDRWVQKESELSFFEKCIFDEIKKHGFTPELFSELEPDSDDHSDYYIGIQWKNI